MENTDIFTNQEYLKKQLDDAILKYEFFLHCSNDGIWRIDLDTPISIKLPVSEQISLFYKHGFIQECNEVMVQTYGYDSVDSMVGSRLASFLPKNEQNIAFLTSFIESNYNLIDAESSELSKDGKTLHILNSMVSRVEDGYVKSVWGVQRNITELVEKQRALEDVNDELEHFVYSVSHDIQDPIRLIYSYAELLLKKDSLSDVDKKMLYSIFDTAKRIEVFAASFLKHAQTGKATETNVIPVKEAVDLAIKNLEHLVESTGATIECIELLNVDIESTNLIQIFQNLISNSLKYRHPDRAPKIKITSKLLYNYVQFAVEDNGIGIKHEQKDILFHLYQRLPSKGMYKSGIGLSIVKKILNSCGGRINVTSEDGVGTTIYFTLPKGNL